MDEGAAPEGMSVRYIQPEGAVKRYICPGCEGVIPAGTFHLTATPVGEPDLRRHWHRGCWFKERRRHPDG